MQDQLADPDVAAAKPARIGWSGWLAAAGIALAAALVYLNTLHNPFVYDDFRTIVENGSITTLTDWRAILLHDRTRPLVNVSYAIDYRFWGAAPLGFHTTNVLLHVLNVMLFFQVGWRFCLDQRSLRPELSAKLPVVTALTAAGFLAVHPLMSQAVGYVSARADVLCTAFFLSGLLTGRRWLLRGGAGWWIASLLLWLCAMAAKEIGIALPFVLLAYDRLVLGGAPDDARRRLRRWHLPVLGVAAAAAIVRFAVFAFLEGAGRARPEWRRLLDEADVFRRYVGLLLVPTGQSVFHAIEPPDQFWTGRTLAGIGVLALMAAGGWLVRRASPLASLGIGWFLLVLAPGVLLIVFEPLTAMAEHRVYLASCGLFLAAGQTVGWLGLAPGRSRPFKWLVAAAVISVLLSLSARTMVRNTIWSDPVTLWQEAAARSPRSALPLTLLGEALHEAGRHEEASAAFRRSLTLDPSVGTNYLKEALCLAELGRFEAATGAVGELRAMQPASPMVDTGLGIVSLMAGDAEMGRVHFRRAAARDPLDLVSRQWLAAIEEQVESNPKEALRLCEEIQRIVPGHRDNDECIRRNRARLAAAGLATN